MQQRLPKRTATQDGDAPPSEQGDAHRRTDPQALGLAVLTFIALLVGLFFVDVVKENLGLEERGVALGATFSKPYAEYLGLDWKKAYVRLKAGEKMIEYFEGV